MTRKIAEAETRKKVEEMANQIAAAANPASDFEYTESDGEVTITKLKNKEMKGEVVIPRTIDGLPVTSIGKEAFRWCIGLTSVTIPESVTSIGEAAFACCIGLTSVTIPESVTSIGEGVFAYCEGLTSMTIPESMKNIGKNTFESCHGLTSVTIPESVTSIGERAFAIVRV